MKTAEAVERVGWLAPEAFAARYARPGWPVIVSRPIAEWGAVSEWKPARLVDRLGDKRVKVAIAAGGVFDYDPAASNTFHHAALTFREAAAMILSAPAENGVYLMQQSIAQSFPELAGDVRPPELLRGELAAAHFWFGSAGNVTPLHYDPLDNYFLQVCGRKRFLIFSPHCFDELYPFPASARFSHISHVDAERPDLGKHPRFAGAQSWEALLGPGDLLYLPPFWWHHVRSLDVSISLNFWSAPSLAHCLVPAGLRLLLTVYERDRLATMGAPFRGRGGFLATAREVSAMGWRWPAVLLASAALELPLRAACRERGIPERTSEGPRPLAEINRELARADAYGPQAEATIAALCGMFDRARLGREELFTADEVAGAVAAAGELLGGPLRPQPGH
jgi:hypothetical protein